MQNGISKYETALQKKFVQENRKCAVMESPVQRIYFLEAGVGFEPTNDGFANRCLRPLGYPANVVVAGRSIHGNGVGVKVKM